MRLLPLLSFVWFYSLIVLSLVGYDSMRLLFLICTDVSLVVFWFLSILFSSIQLLYISVSYRNFILMTTATEEARLKRNKRARQRRASMDNEKSSTMAEEKRLQRNKHARARYASMNAEKKSILLSRAKERKAISAKTKNALSGIIHSVVLNVNFWFTIHIVVCFFFSLIS